MKVACSVSSKDAHLALKLEAQMAVYLASCLVASMVQYWVDSSAASKEEPKASSLDVLMAELREHLKAASTVERKAAYSVEWLVAWMADPKVGP